MQITLIDILQGLESYQLTGPEPGKMIVSGVQQDSRLVEPGAVFVAVRGVQTDGHRFILAALEKGAVAVVYETAEDVPDASLYPRAAFIRVPDCADALGRMASAFYRNPSEYMTVIGVTGTNGKTTVSTLLWQCFTALGHTCGLIGTVENRIGQAISPATHTTPDACRLQSLLGQMRDAGCTYVFMEASSHAIHQQRIAGVRFAGAVFTNLSHDHLDYHGTFSAYRDAKKLLFDKLPADAFALVNTDDRNGKIMVQNTRARIRTFALRTPADYKGRVLESRLDGTALRFNDADFHARLIGDFNAYNLLAVFGVAMELGLERHGVLTALSALPGAPGRFEYVQSDHARVTGIVDYAHTPDALEKVLETIDKLNQRGGRILTVVGCGGDRDKEKRPVMAAVAARWSDHLILTSDNPRNEEPAQILEDMAAGLQPQDLAKTLVIEQREQAIKTAVLLARSGDVVLVAGKGHETYQEIKGEKQPFDDKAILQKALKDK